MCRLLKASVQQGCRSFVDPGSGAILFHCFLLTVSVNFFGTAGNFLCCSCSLSPFAQFVFLHAMKACVAPCLPHYLSLQLQQLPPLQLDNLH